MLFAIITFRAIIGYESFCGIITAQITIFILLISARTQTEQQNSDYAGNESFFQHDSVPPSLSAHSSQYRIPNFGAILRVAGILCLLRIDHNGDISCHIHALNLIIWKIEACHGKRVC